MQHRWNWALALLVVVGMSVAGMARAAGEEGLRKLKFSECPMRVQKTFEREARGAKIETVEEEVEDGEAWYTADATIKGKKYTITVDEDGTLVDKILGNEEEKRVALADCPKAVQATLKEEAEGVEIGRVTREKQHGVISYYAQVSIGGKAYWITVDEDGTLISKSLDDSDEGGEDRPGAVRARVVMGV